MQILNEYQMAAVTDNHNACLVNANVGSGKTTVLIEKIAWIMKERQADLKDMVVLTFTNKAANEIRERLQSRFPGNEEIVSEDLFFGTFHSVAMKLLQRILPVEEYGLLKDFQVMLPEEELEIAKGLILTKELNIKYKNRLKKRLENFEKKGTDPYEDDLKDLVFHLKIEKQKQNKMTYHDLIVFATELLKKYPQLFVPGWVIIDEVQDCDLDQVEFIDALKKESTSLFAVGDPNQVIYGWRGSAFQIFSALKKRYGAVELSLPVNYRSSQTILQAASRFKQSGDSLIASGEAGDKIKVMSHYDPLSEADYLAGEVCKAREKGHTLKEIGILYRLQNQAEVLMKVFDRYGIPYEVSRKQQFFEEPIINWLYHLCRYLVNDADTTSLVRVVTDKAYGDHLTEKKTIKLLEQEETGSIKLLSQLQQLFPLQEISPEWVAFFKNAIHLEERIGLTSADFRKDMEMADAFFTELIKSGKDLAAFVNEAALSGITFASEETAEQKDAVRLMTLHASKGLEFDTVYLIGMNPGLIPLHGGKEETEEEEQRLLFVGMTRAKRILELSFYQSSPQPLVQPGPSPYLRMLKSDWIDAPSLEKKDQKESARHLQQIKRELLKYQEEHAAQVEPERPGEIAESSVQPQPEKQPESALPGEEAESGKIRILHPRYGKGTVIREDENQITIFFDDFGEKEMLKAFCNFTRIAE